MADESETGTGGGEKEGEEGARDLRYTSHERQNVRVERELDGSGHLARGDRTRMSVLNFSSRHPARTERDPDFAFRPAPDKPPEAAPVTDAAAPPAPPDAAPPADPSLVDRFKRMLGL